jgi:hypothetical protein
VQTLRQALDQAWRVLPADRFAELERLAMMHPKAEAQGVVAAIAIATKQQSGTVELHFPLPEYECAVCHRRSLGHPTVAKDGRLRFVCRCRRGSWTRDPRYVQDAIDAARNAGRRRVRV